MVIPPEINLPCSWIKQQAMRAGEQQFFPEAKIQANTSFTTKMRRVREKLRNLGKVRNEVPTTIRSAITRSIGELYAKRMTLEIPCQEKPV